jgi:cellulose synthase/poly-beta-1,6-N-acetylglucosamine synthase-like glycosyltransferase
MEGKTLRLKRPHLWLLSLFIWSIELAYGLGPSLWLLNRDGLSATQRLAFFTCCSWLSFAWLCSSYYFAFTVFGLLRRPKLTHLSSTTDLCPPVALLYVTRNDFCASAIASCVRQNYPSFHVFILDDSDDGPIIEEINQTQKRFENLITVIRRGDRVGFKAGNLNNGLRIIDDSFAFFAVCDADGILPPDFLCITMRAIQKDNSIGFVQAVHKTSRTEADNRFIQDMGPAVEMYWRVFRSAERFGFTMLHGHGAIVRKAAWQAVGGFPEIVSEDLAFSTQLAESGYYGAFEDRVCCEELFPANYRAFCRRQMRYVRGTAEHARLFLWQFLKSGKVSWVEKADRTLATAIMLSPAGLLLFFGAWCALGAQVRSSLAGNLAMAAFSALTLVVPLSPALLYRWETPRRLVCHLFASVAVYLSIIPASAVAAVLGLCTPVKTFAVTGERRLERAFGPGDRVKAALLTLMAVTTAWILFKEGLIGPVPVFVAIGFGCIANVVDWDHRITRGFSMAPAISIGVVLAMVIARALPHAEVRAQVPEAQGLWPAIWMLGNNIPTAPWPACGEMDVQERVNAAGSPDWNEGSIHGTGFTGGTGLGTVFNFPKGQTAAGWHTYGMIWSKGSVAYYIDDPAHPYVTYTTANIGSLPGAVWPFDAGQSNFIIMNVAVGGDWPGAPDKTTPFPSEMLVDYVRVYTN